MLSRALGLPRDAAEAARQVAEALELGRTRTISLGRVNGRRFGFSAGIGLDAELVRRVDALGRARGRQAPGRPRLLPGAALRLLGERRGRFEPALEIAGPRTRGVRARREHRSVHVRRVVPAARDARGAVRARPRLRCAGVRSGRGVPRLAPLRPDRRRPPGPGRPPLGHDLDRIEIACDRPLPLQVDGEDLGDVEAAVFEAERNAVNVLV